MPNTIKKVKLIEDSGKIEIDCINNTGSGENIIKGIFAELAAPEFYKSFEALRKDVGYILELPLEMSRFDPFAVTFSYESSGRMGAVISSKFNIPNKGKQASSKETTINTPLMKGPLPELGGQSEFTQEQPNVLPLRKEA